MFHGPATPTGKDPSSPYKTRLGVWMFLVYAVIYAGFVAINLIKPAAMETVIFMGLNLAVLYGMGLIVFALVLALVYNHLCGAKEAEMAAAEKETTR